MPPAGTPRHISGDDPFSSFLDSAEIPGAPFSSIVSRFPCLSFGVHYSYERLEARDPPKSSRPGPEVGFWKTVGAGFAITGVQRASRKTSGRIVGNLSNYRLTGQTELGTNLYSYTIRFAIWRIWLN